MPERAAGAEPHAPDSPVIGGSPGSAGVASEPAEQPEHGRVGRTGRLWIALGVSVAFVVVGVGVLWVLVSDREYFTGGVGSVSEQATIEFVMRVAPGFVEAGIAGIVVVLVVWAVAARRGARAGTRSR